MSSFLGEVGEAAETTGAITPGWSLPLPLPWQGQSDYGHPVNIPQSEAGLWSAIALERLLGREADVDGKIRRAMQNDHAVAGAGAEVDDKSTGWGGPSPLPWEVPCSSTAGMASESSGTSNADGVDLESKSAEEGMPSCSDAIALMALDRIHEVQQHYFSLGIWYESNLTLSLVFQVRSAIALSSGRLQAAIDLAERAARYETAAVPLPTSTSLFFTPGTAFHGALALRIASVAMPGPGRLNTASSPQAELTEALIMIPGLRDGTSVGDLLLTATKAFEQCLEGRPQLPLCQLGAARSLSHLPQREAEAKAGAHHYQGLLSTWGAFMGEPASRDCKAAWLEARSSVEAKSIPT